MAYGARLESVLGESPRGFESPILRQVTGARCTTTNLPLIWDDQVGGIRLPAAAPAFMAPFVDSQPARMALRSSWSYAVLSRVVRARGVDEDEGVS